MLLICLYWTEWYEYGYQIRPKQAPCHQALDCWLVPAQLLSRCPIYLGKLEEKGLVVYIINVLQTNADESKGRVCNVRWLEHAIRKSHLPFSKIDDSSTDIQGVKTLLHCCLWWCTIMKKGRKCVQNDLWMLFNAFFHFSVFTNFNQRCRSWSKPQQYIIACLSSWSVWTSELYAPRPFKKKEMVDFMAESFSWL